MHYLVVYYTQEREVRTMATMTKHFRQDRADRYAFIATRVGIGTIIQSYEQPIRKHSDGCVVNVTTTGVAIVKNGNGEIVTMYVLTESEANKYFPDGMPMLLRGVIKANMRKKYHLLQNEVKY